MGLKAREKLGKYKIERKLATGGFAEVYQAHDTVEGIKVAIKIPFPELVNPETLANFKKEVRITSRLDHPNILPIKTAGQIGKHFAIVTPLGIESLAERLQRRMSRHTVLELADQLLEALACAHRRHIMHCDLKPENLVLFPENRLRLADFGIARVAMRTLNASGSGTVGYIAPEQALGRPSLRSDVFSAGMVIYRMMSGKLPEWPFSWPLPGMDRVRRNYHPDMEKFLRRALDVDQKKRFGNAVQMLDAFQRLRSRALGNGSTRRKKARKNGVHWKALRLKQFRREHGRALATRHSCKGCHGPLSEAMQVCPWCGRDRQVHRGETSYPGTCPRCKRGVKLDWKYCAWCYGAAIGPVSDRSYSDARYERRCTNSGCSERTLVPFSRYCPWCRRKATHKWKIVGTKDRCTRCGWAILKEYWDYCPWCGKRALRE